MYFIQKFPRDTHELPFSTGVENHQSLGLHSSKILAMHLKPFPIYFIVWFKYSIAQVKYKKSKNQNKILAFLATKTIRITFNSFDFQIWYYNQTNKFSFHNVMTFNKFTTEPCHDMHC